MGSLDGARSLALLAATRPARVSGLIAFAPSGRGSAASAPAAADSAARAIQELTEWPGPLTALYVPQWATDPVRNDRLKRFFQAAATPRQAARLLRMSLTSDISAALPLVQAPTLVIHPRDLQLVAPESVREFAALIPGARLCEVPGDAAMVFAVDVELIADIVEEFVTGVPPPARTDRILATVLFSDIKDSTARVARAGDRAWTRLLDRYLAAMGTTVAGHGGELIKNIGDGVLALFTGPAQGVRCASRLIKDAGDLNVDVRTGLHTGEVERTGGDVRGLAVHLAARIMGIAEPGEILVSRTVRDLVIGSELSFTERGEHYLKGFADPWTLYAASL
jgi:class 3 adenylate cyclase